jgi:hypothetical protein
MKTERCIKMFIQLSISDFKSLNVEVHYQNSTTNSLPKTFYHIFNELKHLKRLQKLEMYQNVNN